MTSTDRTDPSDYLSSQVERVTREFATEHARTAATWVDIDDQETAAAIFDDCFEPATSGVFGTDDEDRTLEEIAEVAECLVDKVYSRREFVASVYGETFAEVYRDAVQTRAADYLRGCPAHAFVTIDGEHVPAGDDVADGGTVAVVINEGAEDHELRPLAWCNSARIHLDAKADEVTVTISTGDPRGAFGMSIRRIPAIYDGAGEITNPDKAGRLVMHVPYEGMSLAHEPLAHLHFGNFLIGDPAPATAEVAR